MPSLAGRGRSETPAPEAHSARDRAELWRYCRCAKHTSMLAHLRPVHGAALGSKHPAAIKKDPQCGRSL